MATNSDLLGNVARVGAVGACDDLGLGLAAVFLLVGLLGGGGQLVIGVALGLGLAGHAVGDHGGAAVIGLLAFQAVQVPAQGWRRGPRSGAGVAFQAGHDLLGFFMQLAIEPLDLLGDLNGLGMLGAIAGVDLGLAALQLGALATQFDDRRRIEHDGDQTDAALADLGAGGVIIGAARRRRRTRRWPFLGDRIDLLLGDRAAGRAVTMPLGAL